MLIIQNIISFLSPPWGGGEGRGEGYFIEVEGGEDGHRDNWVYCGLKNSKVESKLNRGAHI